MLEPVTRALDVLDERVDEAWEVLRGRQVLDRVFYTASELADFSLLWHVLATGRSLVPPADPRFALEMSAALGIESAVVNGGIKSLFKRRRPVVQTERPLYLRVPRTTSFPSGHASSAFLAASLLARRDPRLRVGYYALATLVATSRVHVKIHHASDVIAGAALGSVVGAIARRLT